MIIIIVLLYYLGISVSVSLSLLFSLSLTRFLSERYILLDIYLDISAPSLFLFSSISHSFFIILSLSISFRERYRVSVIDSFSLFLSFFHSIYLFISFFLYISLSFYLSLALISLERERKIKDCNVGMKRQYRV